MTYERIGCAGQSSTKTFENEERCSAEAEKIIQEKTGKGYIEEVGGVAVPTAGAATAKPRGTRALASGAVDAEETIASYNRLLEQGIATQLLSLG